MGACAKQLWLKACRLWWSCSLRLNLHVHRYFGQEGFIIMPWLFHGDHGGWLPRHRYSYATEKCLRTHPTRQLFKPGLRQGREHAAKKGLNCKVRCWSRNTKIKKAPVNSMPSLNLPVHPNVLNSHSWILNPAGFCCLHARRLAAMHWVTPIDGGLWRLRRPWSEAI